MKRISKKKIFNDPVYGFVSVPYGIIFQLIEHPYFQRLRRIKQVSMTHFVYPGALHTRFHHALGALHLMGNAIDVLRAKDVEISEEEALAVQIAILLHDIGHGPFSHTLENTLINVPHERLSLLFMQRLNKEFNGALDLTLQIFNNQYHRKFLNQLVSGQLDMDRMDYLNRDSFFTGVSEGVIGYDRIIKMLAVHKDQLVVEEKGIYSIEKFLIARRLMYWQVYLHKTVLSAEQMLIKTLERAKELSRSGIELPASLHLKRFLETDFSGKDFDQEGEDLLHTFAMLDDFDIVYALKCWVDHPDKLLSFLSSSLINRRLYKLEFLQPSDFAEQLEKISEKAKAWNPFGKGQDKYLVIHGKETNSAYSTSKEEINILLKNGTVSPMSQCSDYDIQSKIVTKHYLCYPKQILRS